MVVELPLELFICEIYAKLLEGIELEHLETEDIEDTGETVLFVFLEIVSVEE